MTGLEITLLCILTAVSTASGVVIWRQHQEYSAFREEVNNVIKQLVQQLRYLQMQIPEYQNEDEDSWETLH